MTNTPGREKFLDDHLGSEKQDFSLVGGLKGSSLLTFRMIKFFVHFQGQI